MALFSFQKDRLLGEFRHRGEDVDKPRNAYSNANERQEKQNGIDDGFPEQLFVYSTDGALNIIKFFVLRLESIEDVLIHTKRVCLFIPCRARLWLFWKAATDPRGDRR